MITKRYEFDKDDVWNILLEHLVSEGICDVDALHGGTWWGDGFSITVEWNEMPKCNVCGKPLSDEECEVQRRLDIFMDWLMSDKFYDEFEEDGD